MNYPLEQSKNESNLNLKFQLARQKPDWGRLEHLSEKSFLMPDGWCEPIDNQPLYLDLGAGMGSFLISEAEKDPNVRWLGIDPSYKCVKRVLQKLYRRQQRGTELPVRYYYGSIYHLLDESPLFFNRIYINYPDPWFKKKHLRRRLVTSHLLERLATTLPIGGEIFIQTDISDYADLMMESLDETKSYLIQTKAEALFEGLSTTLYQQKAKSWGHPRFCFHLTKKS